jgi:hypothetical protein
LNRTLANSFPPCGISVVSATDSMIYKSDVYSASALSSKGWFDEASDPNASKRSSSERGRRWGDKAVLVLVGLRLGLDGVNPIYNESIKVSITRSSTSLRPRGSVQSLTLRRSSLSLNQSVSREADLLHRTTLSVHKEIPYSTSILISLDPPYRSRHRLRLLVGPHLARIGRNPPRPPRDQTTQSSSTPLMLQVERSSH